MLCILIDNFHEYYMHKSVWKQFTILPCPDLNEILWFDYIRFRFLFFSHSTNGILDYFFFTIQTHNWTNLFMYIWWHEYNLIYSLSTKTIENPRFSLSELKTVLFASDFHIYMQAESLTLVRYFIPPGNVFCIGSRTWSPTTRVSRGCRS